MPRTLSTVAFQALELKGSLLPSSLLEAIAQLERPKELLLSPADYGLPRGERLRDRLDAAWVRLQAIWADYRAQTEQRSAREASVAMAERLLSEVLGWPALQACNGWQQGELHYPITHRAFDGAVPLILEGLEAELLDQGLAQFGQEGRKRSAHSCLQECLNADDDADWGLLISSSRLRLLHDNLSLVKPAYLSVDLEALVEGDAFDEFAVVWLLLHASRFRHPQTGSCVLDQWKQDAEATGERVLGQLRGGVQAALESLGHGFINHPENQGLRDALASGQLSPEQFHGQLLRLVYRFLFLFTAEDRELLFPRAMDASDPRRQIYREGYSLHRLRELALKRSAYEGNYGDLWQLQRLVMLQLSQSDSPLGLPGLGGLFRLDQCADLQSAELHNGNLLTAIRAIGWFDADGTLTRVRYRDLNTEELGSVYEGLLELHPQLERQGGQWGFGYGGGAGSERKTSGSYYTPDVLVQELIKSALVPVIDERLAAAGTAQEKEAALLGLRVIDPACGSGHFLLAAARRLAMELAQVRAGDNQPSEAERQQALRDVVRHCIYAVDKNPMAIELCKVALWIEALEPGKPLSFLDAHIQCGDGLVGVMDLKALEDGIPDEAYKPLSGDEKTICASLKKENTLQRKQNSGKTGAKTLQHQLNLTAGNRDGHRQARLAEIAAMPEDSLAESDAKEQAFQAWLSAGAIDPQVQAADLYCAAFFLSKTSGNRSGVPTTAHLVQLLEGQAISEAIADNVAEAARSFGFFHWPLRFGEVMGQGGFDCVLGNPPWERIKLQEKEFFAARSEAIANAKNKAARDRLIKALSADDAPACDQALAREFAEAKREAESSGEFIRGSGRFELTAVGDLNTYALFAEQFLQLLGPNGRSGVIVPTGIATDNSTKAYFDAISSGGRLVSLYDFENREKLFRDVDSRLKFALLTLGNGVESSDFVFFATAPDQLKDQDRHFSLTADDIALINPNTRTCPVFRSQMDAELTKKIYEQVPVLIDEALEEAGNPWGIRFMTMFHMSNDSHLFFDERSPNRLPLYEAKLIHHYDHRWATYDSDGSSRDVSLNEKTDPSFETTPRYWVAKAEVEDRLKSQEWDRQWLMGWRRITNNTNERTLVASIFPIGAVGDSIFLKIQQSQNAKDAAILISCLSSLTCDFISRQKIGGVNFSFFYMNQIPIITSNLIKQKDLEFISNRVLELTYTAHDLKPWAEDLGYDGSPFAFDPDRRALLRAELDAYYAHLYGLTRDELRYILDPADLMGHDYPSETFRVLKKNELKEFGEYRTQRLVLEAWDRLFG